MKITDIFKQIDDYIAQQEQDNLSKENVITELRGIIENGKAANAQLVRDNGDLHDYIAKLNRQAMAQRVIGVAFCLDMQDIQYKFGGEWVKDKQLDCSSFTQLCFKVGTQGKVNIPRTSHEQSLVGVAVDFDKIEVGDTLHYDFDGDGQITHVGMAMDGKTMIHTNNPTNDINIIAIADYSRTKLVAVRRHIA